MRPIHGKLSSAARNFLQSYLKCFLRNSYCVSGSLDGKLIIWDTWTGNKVQVIPLRSSWVMSVAYAASGNYVACGGMDNMCTVYDVNNRDASGNAKLVRELAGYEGFLSSCRFLDDSRILTGSGDMKLCIWDLESGKKTSEVNAHGGDVVSISLAPDGNQFITGSVDRTCKVSVDDKGVVVTRAGSKRVTIPFTAVGRT